MSFYCDVTIAQPFDGPFDFDVIMKKSANRCDVCEQPSDMTGDRLMKRTLLGFLILLMNGLILV